MKTSPETFERRILLVVMGLTPQIVTETLFKLAVQKTPAFIPTEVHLITTKKGAQSARLSLLGLGSEVGQFRLLCNDYKLTNIVFCERNIHIIPESESDFTSDSESRRHNIVASDFITRTVQQFTRDDSTALHVSLAGGRKTMSYYAGYALSLYGRIQDRLSHVLVNEPFQSNKEFFFPPSTPRRFEVHNRWYSTADAQVILSDIPYVRLHYHIPRKLLNGDSGFQDTVNIIQRFLGPPVVNADLESECILINEQSIRLERSKFVLYLYFCARRQSGLCPVEKDGVDGSLGIIEPYLQLYRQLYSEYSGYYERAEAVLYDSESGNRRRQATELAKKEKAWFGPHRSLINRTIRDTLGERFSKPFLIEVRERDDKVGYELDVPVEAIDIPFIKMTPMH